MHAPRWPTIALAALVLSSVLCHPGPAGVNALPAPVSLAVEAASPAEPIDEEVAAVEDFLAHRHTGLLPWELSQLVQAVVVESRHASLVPALVLR